MANDRVNRNNIWEVLGKKVMVKRIVEREMYKGSISRVEFGGERSAWLEQKWFHAGEHFVLLGWMRI